MINWLKNILKNEYSNRKIALLDLKKEDRQLISDIRSKNLTYLTNKKLKSITKTCRKIEEEKIPGIFIEAGCALGGSTILISSLKDQKRKLNVYDVFDMIPPPSEKDTTDVHERYKKIKKGESNGINGDKYYGYRENLYKIVEQNFEQFNIDREKHNVSLIKGLVQDTLHINEQVAFAHIDVDWYEPVKTCLERITPHLAIGGVLILDDYNDWGGCRKASDEYFQNALYNFSLDDSAGSQKVTRIA